MTTNSDDNLRAVTAALIEGAAVDPERFFEALAHCHQITRECCLRAEQLEQENNELRLQIRLMAAQLILQPGNA